MNGKGVKPCQSLAACANPTGLLCVPSLMQLADQHPQAVSAWRHLASVTARPSPRRAR